MATNKSRKTEKVLRIGIIQDHQMKNERLIFPGESVSIGVAPQNTFSYKIKDGFPASFMLFESQEGKYSLNFTKEMSGKIAEGGQPAADISSFIASNKAKQKGNGYVLPLKESSRGKVTIGEYGFLFQFISAPPMRIRPNYYQKKSFFADDDIPFLCFLSLFFMVAVVGGIFVQQLPEDLKMFEEDEIAERFVKMVVDNPEPEKEEEKEEQEEKEPEPTEDDPDGESTSSKEDEEPEPAKKPKKLKEQVEETKNQSSGDLAAARKAADASALSQVMSSNLAGGVDDLLVSSFGGDSSDKSVEEMLEEHGGNIAQTGSTSTIRGQSDASGRSDSIGPGKGLSKVKTKSSKKQPKAKTITGSMTVQKAQIDGADASCAKVIKKVVRRRGKGVKTCYDRRLKLKPSLKGRVVISVFIEASGKTSDIQIKNDTNDKELTKCIKSKVRSWRFKFKSDQDCSTLADFPFVLAPGN